MPAAPHAAEVLARIWSTLGGVISTQALVSFVDAVLIGIGLVVCEVAEDHVGADLPAQDPLRPRRLEDVTSFARRR